MPSLRILLGPAPRSHPEIRCITQALTREMANHDVRIYGAEDADCPFDYVHGSFEDILRALPAGWEPDLVFFLSPEYNGLPREIENCPYPLIGTLGDWNLGFQAAASVAGVFDWLFTDRLGVEVFRNAGFPRVEHARLFGHVPDQHFRMPGIEQDIDVGIACSLQHDVQRERSRWLARIARLSGRFNVRILTGLRGNAYREAVSRCKITFNRSIRGEMNMRAYEAPACGSLLFYEEENREIREVFQPGEHCVLYNDENLEGLIERWLADGSGRQAMVEAAADRVAEHSIGRQWLRIVERACELGIPGRAPGDRPFQRLKPAERARARCRQALQSAAAGGIEVARLEASTAVREDASNAAALADLGVVCAQAGLAEQSASTRHEWFQAAIESFDHALDQAPHSAVTLANRALLLTMLGRSEAEAALIRALRAIDSASESEFSEGLAWPRAYDGFRVELERALSARDLRGARALYRARLLAHLALLLSARGARADAEAHWRESLTAWDCGATRHDLARHLERCGCPLDAAAELRLAVGADPFRFEARFDLARIQHALGDLTESSNSCSEALLLIGACPSYSAEEARFRDLLTRCATGEALPQPVEAAAAEPIRRAYRILTFNWHEPYLSTVCKTGHQFDIVAPSALNLRRIDGIGGWDDKKRPLPQNASLITDLQAVHRNIQAGIYDLALCFTIHDLRFVYPYDLPRIFCPLSSPKNDLAALYDDLPRREAYAAQLRLASRGALVLYNSEEMGTAEEGGYDLPGELVGLAIDEDDYCGYTGEEAVGLRVGNCLAERWFLNYPIQRQVLEDFPHRILGVNPGIPDARPTESWDDLRAQYRLCRFYFHSFAADFFEAPVSMSLMEAMTTGMPIVTTCHPTTVIRDGYNGFVSDEIAALRGRVRQLLEDRDMAAELGRNARSTAIQLFGLQPVLARWQSAFDRAAGPALTPGPSPASGRGFAPSCPPRLRNSPSCPPRLADSPPCPPGLGDSSAGPPGVGDSPSCPTGLGDQSRDSQRRMEFRGGHAAPDVEELAAAPDNGKLTSDTRKWNNSDLIVTPRPEMPGLVEVRGVLGFLTPGDMQLLVDRAREVPTAGTIVEIGSFMGLSSILMGTALDASGNTSARIHCVDTWEGSPEHQQLPAVRDRKMFELFLSNVEGAGVREYVEPVRCMSYEAVGRFEDGSVDLLFVDGDHTFEGCLRDLRDYFPKVRPGGVIIGHDCIPGGTVEQALRAFCGERGLTARVHGMPANHYIFEIRVPGVSAAAA